MSIPRLFVMRAGAIGDFVLTLPALEALRKQFPTHRVTLAARGDVLPLVDGTLADEVIPFDDSRLTPLFVPGAAPSERTSELLSNLELAVLWLPDSSARTIADNLRRLDAARLIAANPLPVNRHAADHLLDTLAPLGISSLQADATPRLALAHPPELPAASSQAHGQRRSPRVVAMHVGSGAVLKRWPLENFLALAARVVQQRGAHVRLLSGPAENRSSIALPPNIEHSQHYPLADLANMLVGCELYVGNDSGITHLAAALGVRTVALFGPTDPAIWGPRGTHVTVLRSPTAQMPELSLEQVWSVVDSCLSANQS